MAPEINSLPPTSGARLDLRVYALSKSSNPYLPFPKEGIALFPMLFFIGNVKKTIAETVKLRMQYRNITNVNAGGGI